MAWGKWKHFSVGSFWFGHSQRFRITVCREIVSPYGKNVRINSITNPDWDLYFSQRGEYIRWDGKIEYHISLEEWEEFVGTVKGVDEEVHKYWEKELK